VVAQTALAAAIFPVAVAETAMHLEAVREATTGPALVRTAAAVRPAWDLGAEAEGSAAAVAAVGVVADVVGNQVGRRVADV